MPRVAFRPVLLYPIFFFSGAAGLGYQMIWVRQFAAGLGHEVPSIISVMAAFLGGMALGAWALDRFVSTRLAPARCYAGLEGIIGGWGLTAALLIPILNRIALERIGPAPSVLLQWTVVLAVPFLGLLPATLAMGATLPAMDRFLAPLKPGRRCIGALYAANTFGAVAGTLASVFVLAPRLGFRASGIVLASLNVLCGLAALGVAHKFSSVKAVPSPPPAAQPGRAEKMAGPGFLSPLRLHGTLLATGLLGVGYELVGVRVLSLVLENTVYTFAAVLAVYLLGTALGAAAYQRLGRDLPFRPLLSALLISLASLGLLSIRILSLTPRIYDELRASFGDDAGGVLLAEMTVAAAVFALPTLLMGATFSHLVQGARRENGGVGQAAALNTVGCAAAGLVFLLGLLPVLGAKRTLAAISLAYLLLLPSWPTRVWLAIAFPIVLCFALPRDLRLLRLPVGTRVLDYREGALASVAVVRTPDQQRSLRVNHRFQMGGTAAAVAERRQAHIPLLLHRDPRRALFLGTGTGITLGAATAHSNLVSDGVELLPEVVAVMHEFEPENHGPFPRPDAGMIVADARRFVRTTTNRYDVIVGDLFHPAQDGAAFLYTVEHFAAIRDRLRPGGLFCQWLPLHQLDETTLRVIVRTFLEVFPEAQGWLLHFNVDIPVLGLIGTRDGLRLPPDGWERPGQEDGLQQRLKAVNLDHTINLLGCFAAGPKALARFAQAAELNTDNHPVVAFLAPSVAYRRDTRPGDLLLRFLAESRPDAEEVVFPGPEGARAFLANLNDFFAARDLYLSGLMEESAGHLSAAIDLYLESARRSVYFTPAYARCLTIVQVMAATDPAAARALFDRLERAQPAQPLGRRLRERLLEGSPQ